MVHFVVKARPMERRMGEWRVNAPCSVKGSVVAIDSSSCPMPRAKDLLAAADNVVDELNCTEPKGEDGSGEPGPTAGHLNFFILHAAGQEKKSQGEEEKEGADCFVKGKSTCPQNRRYGAHHAQQRLNGLVVDGEV